MNRRGMMALAGAAAVGLTSGATAQTPTTDANAHAAKTYLDEVWNKGNVAAIDQFVSPDVQPTNPSDAAGRDAFKARVAASLRSTQSLVKNLAYTIEQTTAEGDVVVLRGFITGATAHGKKVNALYFDELHFQNGLIVAEWPLVNEGALMGF